MNIDSRNGYVQYCLQEAKQRGYNKELSQGYARDMQAEQKQSSKTSDIAVGVLAGGTAIGAALKAQKIHKRFENWVSPKLIAKIIPLANNAGVIYSSKIVEKPTVSSLTALKLGFKKQLKPLFAEFKKVDIKFNKAIASTGTLSKVGKIIAASIEAGFRSTLGMIKSAPKSAQVVAGVIFAGGIINSITNRAAVKAKYDTLQLIENHKPAKTEVEEQEPEKPVEEPKEAE